MFVHELERAAEAAPRAALHEVSRTIWRALAENAITEADAERLDGIVRLRMAPPPATEPRQRPRSGSRPRTPASMARRRRWAACGLLPPALACQFTIGEQAALAVIAAEVARHGACTLAVGHIAALAGVCPTTTRNALREARRAGLIEVEERKVAGWRNDTNVVRIASLEWGLWLRLGRGGGGGFKSAQPTPTKFRESPFRSAERQVFKAGPQSSSAKKGLRERQER